MNPYRCPFTPRMPVAKGRFQRFTPQMPATAPTTGAADCPAGPSADSDTGRTTADQPTALANPTGDLTALGTPAGEPPPKHTPAGEPTGTGHPRRSAHRPHHLTRPEHLTRRIPYPPPLSEACPLKWRVAP
ncbi:hypothetical protein GCM10009804_75540 [Kribbella hippodromi]|uniref:Uncharacterized protein n=1 Tax=Kribbella hippodromi TaxID=434347 RepID=A0ABP4QIN5_9ACTN